MNRLFKYIAIPEIIVIAMGSISAYEPHYPDYPSISTEISVKVNIDGNIFKTIFKNRIYLDQSTNVGSTVRKNLGID